MDENVLLCYRTALAVKIAPMGWGFCTSAHSLGTARIGAVLAWPFAEGKRPGNGKYPDNTPKDSNENSYTFVVNLISGEVLTWYHAQQISRTLHVDTPGDSPTAPDIPSSETVVADGWNYNGPDATNYYTEYTETPTPSNTPYDASLEFIVSIVQEV